MRFKDNLMKSNQGRQLQRIIIAFTTPWSDPCSAICVGKVKSTAGDGRFDIAYSTVDVLNDDEL
jgi:hypothetical protein